MIPMRSVSAALLLATLALNPLAPATAVTAAVDHAKMTIGMASTAAPVGNLTGMIGNWKTGDLTVLDKAAMVTVYDTKKVYSAGDLKQVASAEASKSGQLGKLRDAIRADASLKAWFDSNKIDVSRVIAVGDPKGSPEIFLY